VGRTIWHIGLKTPTTRQKCRSKKSRTTAPPLRSRPKAAERRWPRNMPQLSRPGLRWRAGRAVATSRMYIVSNISYRCVPHGMSRRNTGSRPGSSPAAFINLSRIVLIALSPTPRSKPTRTMCSAGSSSCMAVRGRTHGRRACPLANYHPRLRRGIPRRRQATRPLAAAIRVIGKMCPARRRLRAPACNRFQRGLATPAHENDGICRRFLPDWDSSLRN
jgi:hypothetical protein